MWCMYSLFLGFLPGLLGNSFLHMTDIHVSVSRPYSSLNLRRFCNEVLPEILANSKDIQFLAVTGDFTDGMGDFLSFDSFGQQERDWTLYEEAMEGCFSQLPVFKIRGNHDCYGVHSFHHPSNEFFKSIQRRRFNPSSSQLNERSTFVEDPVHGSYFFTENNVAYAFLEMGRLVAAPHQYHGEFAQDQADWLKALLFSNKNATAVYVFGHYPMGSLTPASRKRLLHALHVHSGPIQYLSGHIHSVVGKTGVQCLDCHEGRVHELQLSDFKWSGVVRQIEVDSGTFADIPTNEKQPLLRVTLEQTLNDRTNILSVYSMNRVVMVNVGETPIPLHRRKDNIFYFEVRASHVPKSITVVYSDGTSETSAVVDTRLMAGSFACHLFTHWYESLQILLFVMYLVLVVLARSIRPKHVSRWFSLYLILSPVLPNLLCHGLFGRHWVLASGVVLWDLETHELVLDSESTRIGIMLFVYILLTAGVVYRTSPKTKYIVPKWADNLFKGAGLFVLVPVTVLDLRMMAARGHITSVFLSPHFWVVVIAWMYLIRGDRTVKED